METVKDDSLEKVFSLGDYVDIEGIQGFSGEGYSLYRKNHLSLEFVKKNVNNGFFYLRISTIGCSFADKKLNVPYYCVLEFDLKTGVPETTQTNLIHNPSLESEVLYHG